MSRQIGLDLSPFALRAYSLSEDGESRSLSTVYSPKGCAASDEYDSAERWDDPLAFRGRTFGCRFEINDIEKTVDYRKPDASGVDWLKAYVQRLADEQEVPFGSRFVATIPDHATPDEKDNVLRGLGSAGLGKPLLLWRPVAAALYWLGRQADESTLDGHRLVVLDLDGPAPEVTEFELVRHEERPEFVVPVRTHPKRHQILKSKSFHARCYQLVMNGFQESLQLIEGQFSSEVQSALEQGVARKDVWVRRNAAWARKTVELAADLPEGILNGLDEIFRNLSCDEQTHVICVGWLARRYPKQMSQQLKLCPWAARLESNIEVLPAEAVSAGAARFGDLLAKGYPTYYDKLPCYRWWDSRAAEWKKLFGQYQRVEPGHDYVFPAEGKPPCKLTIDKFNDNVSMYVQVMTEDNKEDDKEVDKYEDDTYEENEVYAHRLKLNFAEFLREQQVVTLTARVNPQEGSASFTIMADDPIFQIGNMRSRSATLRYSEDPDATSYSSVQIVHEHEGYLEPQPVLGRIYDSDDNFCMVLASLEPTRREEFCRLFASYCLKYPLRDKYGDFIPLNMRLLTERVGYDATPREPTRGMFGTRRIPDARIDSVSHKFAERVRTLRSWIEGTDWDKAEAMKRNNYLHGWASDAYKQFVHAKLADGWIPSQYNFNFCYAPGYVLGESKGDTELLVRYILRRRDLPGNVKSKLWWSLFRMLSWHQDASAEEITPDLLRKCLQALIDDARIVPFEEKKYLLLALLYVFRIREHGDRDIDSDLCSILVETLSNGALSNVRFPKTMINNMNGSQPRDGDNLSKYVLRFLQRQDDIQDRELGAAMGGV